MGPISAIEKIRILKTNWINITGVFISVYLYSALLNSTGGIFSGRNIHSLVAALILVGLYGVVFWALFAFLLIALDMLLIVRNPKGLRMKLLLEWLLVSGLFIYGTVRYHEWIFLIGIGAFLWTQMVREKLIRRVLP